VADETAVIPFEGETQTALFKDKEIRKVFHEDEWYFSVVDVIDALTDSSNPRRYWSDLKAKMAQEGGDVELYDEIVQLKLEAADGKFYATDTASTETIFRIIQSIPSPKAEPFKRWLARVGFERLQEIGNPELAIKRAIVNYRLMGYDEDWIEARVKTIVSRNELTHEWSQRGVSEGREYAVLTNVISEETFGVGVQRHKDIKGLRRSHNLRDHMTDLELILTMLGEKSTVQIARARDAQGFQENRSASVDGGRIAGRARRNLEQELNQSVVSKQNHLKRTEGSQHQLP
jgi:hypothetical protein